VSSVLDKVYQRSPALIQNIGITLYGMKVYRREYGAKLERLLKQFEKQQWYSESELKGYQEEQLRVLIKHCYDHVPYYRRVMTERKLVPSDIVSVTDLPKLPFLTKDDVRTHQDELLATNVKNSRLVYVSTSGTTGSPLQLYSDKGMCLIKNVLDWRQKRVAGINPGDKLALFLGRVVVPTARKSPPFWGNNWALRHKYFSSFHLSPKNMDLYVTELKRFKPSAVEGYPSTLYILACHLLANKSNLAVKAAFTSSETLFPHQRETIEEAFQCKVFDFYGMAERVVFATECDVHGDKHLNSDFGITEILDADGQPAAPDELGRLVSTGLHNFGMPLVRYKTSDISSMKSARCSCGRGFPLISGVTSKADDIVTTPDGRFISPVVFEHPFKPLRTVVESQIIQEDRKHLRVRIVKSAEYSDQDTAYVIQEIQRRIGTGMEIEIEFVDQIERTSAGKFRRVISNVPLKF
jgi:phenylacetate-CoA ligase